MHQRRYRVWPALVVFGVLFALIAVAPQTVGATGLSVRSGLNADGSKAFILDGNGFGPGEKITVTGLQQDGSTATFPTITANAIGAFSAAVPYNPNVFRIRASGQLTGITDLADVGPVFGTPPGFLPPFPYGGQCSYLYNYNNYCAIGYVPGYYPSYYPGYAGTVPGYAVPAPSTGATLPSGYTLPGAPAPNTSAVPPPSTPPTTGTNTVSVGQPISIPASGFTAGESVIASVTAPNGQATQIGTAPAASDGTVTITITFPSAGTWQVTAHGQTSNKDVVAKYTVL